MTGKPKKNRKTETEDRKPGNLEKLGYKESAATPLPQAASRNKHEYS
jgi:hypothetical protein